MRCVVSFSQYNTPYSKLIIFSGFKSDSAPGVVACLLHLHVLRATEWDHLGEEAFERALETGPQTKDQFENLFRGRETASRGPQARDRGRTQVDLRPLRLCHWRYFNVDEARLQHRQGWEKRLEFHDSLFFGADFNRIATKFDWSRRNEWKVF